MVKKDKRTRVITALAIAGVMLLGVAVAPVAATIGTQTSAFDDQDKSQRCKKNKKGQKKKCRSSSPTPSGTSIPSTAPTGGGGGAAGRVVELPYECPCAGLFHFQGFGGGPVTPGADETSMTVVVEDGSGDPIPVLLQQDGASLDGGEVCGSTTEPIAIQPDLEIDAFVGSPEICPALAQGGVIKFTFLKG